ncbi:inosine/xanthosine triphosphatase [Marivirga sp. S37H4]|uniref:Probable inosine/xanthosine triphosphatase n=1 Tax=Marivirga aurantiaca TaxID=2802615 RepID=A0A934WUZ7_9BACT|nr:inosine/xanthosine triphosphatase [Marivirga aurantiaca]MBK6263523.1 inosine/xanthosine triphosphatase [Marivirga aurantiaca]
MNKKVIIASKNPVKINAVKNGFEKMFPSEHFEFVGISVPSGVRDQPRDNQETKRGAFNRSVNAKKQVHDAHFWVGIEGGIDKIENEMEAFAWVVIQSEEMYGKAKTGTLYLPQAVVALINEGKELGEADDLVFGHTNSKQKNGAVGILTGNIIDRTSYYTHAVIMALIPFKNADLYKLDQG